MFIKGKTVPDNRLCSTLQLGHGCHTGIPCTDTDAEKRKTKREMARAFYIQCGVNLAIGMGSTAIGPLCDSFELQRGGGGGGDDSFTH